MIKNLIFLLLLLSVITFNCFATVKTEISLPINITETDIQTPYFQTLDLNSSVFNYVNYEIAQDTEGFLWFAGHGGLTRFDGYELVEFKHDDNNKYSIAENAVRSITADNNGGLWVSLYNLGLSHYNAKTKQFTHYPHDKSNPNSPSSNTIRDIIVLENDDLWIAGKGGLSYYNNKTKMFSHFVSGTDIKNDNYILDMTIDNNGKLWLSTAKGLKVFDDVNKKLVVPDLIDKSAQALTPEKQSRLFRKLITAQDGKIWLAGYHQNVHILDPQTKVMFPLPPREGGGKFNHMSINQVNENEIWVSNLSTGIEVFNPQTLEKTKHIAGNNKKKHLLKRNNVDVIFTDQSGTIWLSFHGESPQYYNQNLSAFQYFQFGRQANGEGILRLLPLDEEKSLISVFKYLAIFDKKQGTFSKFDFPLSKEYQDKVWEISELAIGSNNDVWLGSVLPLLIKVNIETQQEHYYTFEQLGVEGNTTYEVNYISESEIILSTSGGAIKFNPQTELFSFFKTTQGEDITKRMWRSLKSNQGDYLLTSNEGLFHQLAGQKGFSFIPLNQSTFKGSSVEMAKMDQKGRLWVFTNQALYQAEIKNNKITLIEVPEPDKALPIDRLAITIDEQDHIWLGPYVYYDPEEKKYINLSHYNYTNRNSYNDMVALDNTVYAVSDKEILVIDKDKIKPLKHQAPIKLSELTSGNQLLREQNIDSGVIIQATSQEFSAKFSALDFAHANNTTYQYKLKGLDNFWRYASAEERRATYTSLPPGDFTLEIKAQHKNGKHSHQTLSIPITVMPKFYQTWWFITCIVALTALLLWFIHKLFLQKAVHREQELNTHKLALERAKMMEELIEKKNQLLADVSHELGTPLTVLKLQVESLKDELEDDVQVTYDALDNKLDDIQHLINDIHQLAQSDVGALQLNMETFEFNETLDFWQRELTQFVNKNKLSFEINRQLPSNLMVEFDRDRIKQIFTNLLTNSIKYTDKPGKVILSASIKKNTLLLSIEDSGPGVSTTDLTNIFERLYRVETSRSRDTGGSGLGLAICKSLIEEHNGRIYANHSNLGGLKISMELPIL